MQSFLKGSALVLIIFCQVILNSRAQTSLQYFLPEGQVYDQNIPTPASVIGHEIGEWHVTHDKLVYYYTKLAEASARVTLEQMGKTHEGRPLLNVIITSEQNQQKLEQLRIDHLKLSDPELADQLDVERMPVVVRLGYSVHGNEASGSNGSLLVAYYLAAAQGDKMDEMLEKCIILIDPSLNPDGMQRFSGWVNQHRSMILNSDPNDREFRESWPNGRTNHYWFDLNRDWLLAQHPESVGRLRAYHNWRPNVQTDHHEMGSEATFFFQPGVPSRKHPLIPNENVVLTKKIGKYHAEALDDEKRLYYTKETFDDFYFGKGSTYPDIHGAVGILFEQASVRGHVRKTQNGEMSFAFAIKNQVISSLSTLDAAFNMRTDLLSFQRDFYKDAVTTKKRQGNKGLIFGTGHDAVRAAKLAEVLINHKVIVHRLSKDIKIADKEFIAGSSFIIPYGQPQNKVIDAVFDRRTTFKDSLFYDVSAWSFDLAFNADLATIENLSSVGTLGEQVKDIELPDGTIIGDGKVAYVIEWGQYFAPALLNALLEKGIRVKVATESFIAGSGKKFARGSLLIATGIQEMDQDELLKTCKEYAQKYHVKVHALNSGLSSQGVDLGSSSFQNIRKPEIAMIVGSGASGYATGEVWHLLDQRYQIKVTKIASDIIDQIELDSYNVILLPGGSYSSLNTVAQGKIKDWVMDGGTLVASKDALRFVSRLQIADLKFKRAARDTVSKTTYADTPKKRGAQVIGGAIYKMDIDKTHPLAYGYDQNTLAVFKQGTLALETARNTSSNPFVYASDPLLSGYSSSQNIENIKGTPAVCVSSFGQGKVIAFVDNYNFRAYWYGTNQIYMNSIFFGDQISTR